MAFIRAQGAIFNTDAICEIYKLGDSEIGLMRIHQPLENCAPETRLEYRSTSERDAAFEKLASHLDAINIDAPASEFI